MISIDTNKFVTAILLCFAPYDSLGQGDQRYLRQRRQSSWELGEGANNENASSLHPKKTSSRFNIALMNMGDDKSYDDLFRSAAEKWQKIVVGDLPDTPKQMSASHDWFGNEWGNHPPVNIDIDDVLIGYSITSIDGLSGTLGFAGPVYSRQSKEAVTAISGIMKFDKADFDIMPSGDAELVILHEMGHVLGIGTFWEKKCGANCPINTSYSCNTAKLEYHALGFTDDLNLEPEICGHWSESNFGYSRDEIMTPYFDENAYQPISRITCAALFDLGYEVNFDAADPSWVDRSQGEMDPSTIVPSNSFFLNAERIKRPETLTMG